MYSEEIFYALNEIANSLQRPDNGHCIVLFHEHEIPVSRAIIRFRPAGFGSMQRHPPIFYAVITKEYDKPCNFTLLRATDDAAAIREGIRTIDDISADDAEAATQQWAAEGEIAAAEATEDDIAF